MVTLQQDLKISIFSLCNYLGEICLKRDIANERIVIVSNIDNDPNNYLTIYLELDYYCLF